MAKDGLRPNSNLDQSGYDLFRSSPDPADKSPAPVSGQPELANLCDSYQSRTRTNAGEETAAEEERRRLGYQTSATATNVATKDREGSSQDMYDEEKKQVIKGGEQKPKPFPPPASGSSGKKPKKGG